MALRSQSLKMGKHKITGIQDGVDPKDAVNKGQLDAAIAAIPAPVTSVAVSGGSTGLTTSGGPITTSGTITLAGTLGAENGGTGATSLTSNNVILGNGTSAVQFVAPGTSGNILTSNGTTWASSAPSNTWVMIKKTSNQSITSSTTFVDDNELKFSMSTNTTYVIRVVYTVLAGATGGSRVAANGPAGVSNLVFQYGISTTATSYNNTIFVGGSLIGQAVIDGIITCGSTAGTFTMRICQQASSATPTVFAKGSYLEYMVI